MGARAMLWRSCVGLGLALVGCGDDGAPPRVDAGPPDPNVDAGPADDPVANDDPAPTTGCADVARCDDDELSTACTCVRAPREEEIFASNLTGCDELTTSGEIVRTPEDDFCSGAGASQPVDIGCFMEGMYRTRGDSSEVTVYGVVDVFGNGGDADAITVEIYAEGSDGNLGSLIGSATADIAHPCTETEDEIENDEIIGTRQLGYYVIEGVPTETPLIVKSSGDAGFWRDLYAYNVYIPNDEVEDGGPEACEGGEGTLPDAPRWEYRPRIISRSDWVSIPLTAGQPEGIRPGSGVVGGEVHDCGDIRVEFAQVNTNPAPITLTYFNDNPDNPLPDMSRTEGTSLLGLYGALDIREGPVDVAAVGRIGGRNVSLGWYKARAFAGAVSVVTLRGPRPHQVP